MAVSNVDLNKIKEQLSVLTIQEIVALTEILKDHWNLKNTSIAAASAATTTEAVAEKTEFDLILTSAGDQKIGVIKVVRQIRPELGLKEAKDLVDGAPITILPAIKKSDAEGFKAELEKAGAKVEIK